MMVNFIPIPGAPYKHDYVDFFRTIANSAGRVREIPAYREMCKNDLFFLLLFGLNREDINQEPKGNDKHFLIRSIREVEDDHDNTLDLWAREHYKSTIITYGLPIQELIQNPEERIAFFSHTRPIAKGFLRQIKMTLEDNVPVKRWFPDIFYSLPKSQAPKWSEDDGLYVKRKTHPKEASIEAWGIIDGQPTSKHFTIRIYDDLVTKEGVTTPEMIKKVADAYELSHSLGTDGGRMRLAGTHYHFADLYTVLKKRSGYKVRIKPATVDSTPTGEPVFLSPKRLSQLLNEQGSYIFSCQQLLNPIAGGDQKFQIDWLKHYDELPARLNVYMLCDPANEKRKRSDYTTMAAIGVDPFDNYFLMRLIRDKLNLHERWIALRDMYIDLSKEGYIVQQPVGYEKYGKDSDIFYLEKQQEKEGIYFTIQELGGKTGKWDRIMNMVPFFERGRFRLPRRYFYTPKYCDTPGMEGKAIDMIKTFIDEEYYPAPYCLHDDMFDCISRIQEPKMGVTPPVKNKSNLMPGGSPILRTNTAAVGWMAG
jgi:hypothetical protein